MPTARLVGRVAASVVALLVVASLVLGGVVLGAVRRTLPRTDGDLVLRGLSGRVDVLRDARGVPNIYASSAEDLFLAQGFVSAQDRFFEMDLRRHATAGRLAELVGEAGVDSDRLVRTLGWRRVAAAELPRLSADTRRYLQAYAQGVNTYLDSRSTPSSVAAEYLLLGTQHPGYEIERWDAVDSLTWLKAMAWDLRGNHDDELARAQMLADGIPLTTIQALYPTGPDRRAAILSTADWAPPANIAPTTPKALVQGAATDPVGGLTTSPARSAAGRNNPVPTPGPTRDAPRTDEATAIASARTALGSVRPLLARGDGIGSNSWVVSGRRSTTGKPLLANDPHLGLSMPGIWHQVGLHCRTVGPSCPFDVTGFTFAGLPGVVIGRTPQVAWGFTNLDPDVSDFYLEKVSGGSVERGGATEPLTTRSETITVAGGASVTLDVRSTRHGPIISDVVEGARHAGDGLAVALAWTGLVPGRNADALFMLDRARSGADVRAALELFSAPGQNCVYATTDGHIGYQAPGLVPVRASATPGTPPGWLPAPGWDPAFDWQGYVPYAAMPHVEDPAEGFVVTANQRATDAATPFLTTDWTAGWRSERIRDRLTATPRVSPDDMRSIQSDSAPQFGRRLATSLLAVPVEDPFVREGQDTLRGWAGTHPVGPGADSRAAVYVEAVWREVLGLVITPRVGHRVRPDGGHHWTRVVDELLDDPRASLWDDPRTPAIETRDSVLLTAMTRARSALTRTLGKDPDRWDWGRVHTVTLGHPLGDGLPGLVRRGFERGPYPAPGSTISVDAFGGDLAVDGFAVQHGPSMRLVADLGRPDESTWVNQSGVSGHPADEHYADQVQAWLANEPFPWPSTPAGVEAASTERLRLDPDPSGN